MAWPTGYLIPTHCLLCFLQIVLKTSIAESRFYDPKPNPNAIVTAGKARFTVLTDHIIRMEWGNTVDAPTFGILNRNLPLPKFTTSKNPSGWTIIKTQALTVLYDTHSDVTFNENNLKVSFELNGHMVAWKPQPATEASIEGNLLGTFRTLDYLKNDESNAPLHCFDNPRADLHCTLGLISRQGYTIVDETNRPQFTDDEWPWVTAANVTSISEQTCDVDHNEFTVDVWPWVTDTTPHEHKCNIAPEKRLACGGNPIDFGEFDCTGRGCCYVSKPSSGPYCYYSTKSYQDLYFFGHGHNYRLALKEFTMLSGPIPIPPRFAFGIYYSRYWAYNDIGDMDIVDNYEQRGIPLDVLLTDMDWHMTFHKEKKEGRRDLAGWRIGGTGFTWNKYLFPDPKMFLDWCQLRGLKNALNLHTASGVQPWEEKFVEMAEAMGITPSNDTYVPFKPNDVKFVENWLRIFISEREKEGIDFWWLDWQQGEDWIKVVGVNPTFWLNYLFFTNPYHWNRTAPKLTRPFILHRWGGLGNHRYQGGFSGDVIPSWNSLRFQVYFTICATNVGFGYWSHDIGGHIGPTPPELYTRWIQWGTFSPIFRTHCSKNPNTFRRIWLYPPEHYPIMRSFMRLRLALVPYLYTQAHTAYATGLSILRGMYYDYPDEGEAYSYMASQYLFGDSLLVAPITEAVNNVTGMVSKKIWIPEGAYVSWISGEVVKGPQVIERHFTLYEMPLFAKAGAIIPMRTDDYSPLGSAQEIPNSLKLMTFVGGFADSGSGTVYEDDGRTVLYMSGASSTQSFSYSISGNVLTFTISEASNPSVLGLTSRSYEICLFGSWAASTITSDGDNVQYTPLRGPVYSANTWTYDGSSLTLMVTTSPLDLSKPHTVKVTFPSSPLSSLLQGNFVGMARRYFKMKQLLDEQWGVQTVYQEDYFSLLNATEIAPLNSYYPAKTQDNLNLFSTYSHNAVNEIQNLSNLKNHVKQRILAVLQNP